MKGDAAKVELQYEWIAGKSFLRGETTIHNSGDDAATPGGIQIIGKDPLSGEIVSWYFDADGGHGYGVWTKDGARWMIQTVRAVPMAH